MHDDANPVHLNAVSVVLAGPDVEPVPVEPVPVELVPVEPTSKEKRRGMRRAQGFRFACPRGGDGTAQSA